MNLRLDIFNALPESDALTRMLTCCHSWRWATRMLVARPFDDMEALLLGAEEIWRQMGEPDFLEAFRGHARIGDVNKLRDKYSRAHAEQGQVAEADEAVLHELLSLNRKYEIRHGFIFIVCATGKSAEEMLALLQRRLPNSRAQELTTAAAEQAKITAIRLRALFAEQAAPETRSHHA